MDLPLQEIKQVLEYDDLQKIVDFLAEAEKKVDEKIAALQYSKTKSSWQKQTMKENCRHAKIQTVFLSKRYRNALFYYPKH